MAQRTEDRPVDEDAAATAPPSGPPRWAVFGAGIVTIIALLILVLPRLTQKDDGAHEVDRYTVRSGDTISSVAQLHAITTEDLEEANGLNPSSSLEPGTQITIPPPQPTGNGLPTGLRNNDDLLALRPIFEKWADEYGVPVALLEADLWQESNWDNEAVSPDGAVGIGQLLPATTEYINEELLDGASLDPTVAEENIQLSARYFDYLLDQTDDDWAATLAAYFSGLSAAQARPWDTATLNYITGAMTLYPDFEETR
jgi:LysM repeat protein